MEELRLGETLTRLLKDKRLTLKEVSKATGIPVSSLSELTSNRPTRDPIKLKKLASFLQVSIHFLLFGREDEHHQNSEGAQKQLVEKVVGEKVLKRTYEISIRRIYLKSQ